MDFTQRGTVLVAADAGANDQFGSAVALSSDGAVLAVGAWLWDDARTDQGGVYIFDRAGDGWTQRGSVLIASDRANSDQFGSAVALSGDGSLLVVGAWKAETNFTDEGQVYFFDWNGTAYVQRAGVLSPADAGADDFFGAGVALSSDGLILAIGAPRWDGAQTDQGGVYIFDWSGSAWVQRGSVLTAAGAAASDEFGRSVAISSTGTILAVGAPERDGDNANEGAAYVYEWSGSAWALRSAVLSAGTGAQANGRFGRAVALSGDGARLLVGAGEHDEGAVVDQGVVYVYDWNGAAYVQDPVALLHASPVTGDKFGSALALSSDGAVLSVGAIGYDGTLTDQGGVYVYDAPVTGGTDAQVIPLTLTTTLLAAAQPIPLRLLSPILTAAQSITMRLQALDEAAYGQAALRWTVGAILGAADISAAIVGEVRISHEENASGICSLSFMPTAGAIDPESYELQPLRVDFVGLSAAGAELYRVRRYTGTVSVASYDPQAGVVEIEATTDLQGRLEAMTRAQIDEIIGGRWSPHVFDDTADGWQYAQDRLSTRTAEMHVDRYGQIQVIEFTAAATATREITDAGRFSDTLSLRRASRRDLVSRWVANLDFRYVRLRHREVTVSWPGHSFCFQASLGFPLCTRQMVQSAADGTAWTRTSAIVYAPLPPVGTYCTPTIAWAGDEGNDLCLGARWTAARRWAQTITEEYSVTVLADDLAEQLGDLPLSEDYGIEATYDASDYEADTNFATAPAGSVFDAAAGDYVAEATAAEYDGRAALAIAQQVVLDRGRAEILRRARQNVVTFSPVYRPDIDLSDTLLVTTPYLVCQGKVRAYDESMDLQTGRLDQTVEIALSRHGGSGLPAGDDLVPPDPPTLPAGSDTGRAVFLGLHIGGTLSSVAEDEEWDGYAANVDPLVQAPGSNLYTRRFVVKMPEIETAARDATEAQQVAAYHITVPQDLLTLGA